MKKLLLQFMLLTSAFIAVSVGCAKDPIDGSYSKFTLGAISAGSVEIIAETKSAIRYAYSVTTDLTATAPDAAILFSGDNITGELKDGSNIVNVNGLAPETKFRIFICAEYSVNDNVTLGNVTTLTTTETGAFTDFVTFIPSNEHRTLKFWVNVPENDTLAYNLIDAADYDTFISEYDYIPADFISGNETKLTILTESQMIKFTHWGDPENPEESNYKSLRPGQPIQVVIGQVTEKDSSGRKEYEAKFDFSGFAESAEGLDQKDFWNNPELHHMDRVNVKAAVIVPEKLIKLELISSTMSTAYIQITPDESVSNYAFSIMPTTWWTETAEKYGEEAAIFFLQDFGQYSEVPVMAEADLEAFKKYRISTIVKMNDEATLLSVSELDFEPLVPTKPAPTIIVTEIDDPSGEKSPWNVWFNIRSTSKDLKSVMYVLNYARDWALVINDGFRYSDMLKSYGTLINDLETLNAITSAEGYNMKFDSWYNMESIIAVQSFNDEDNSSDPDSPAAGDVPVCSSWSDNLPDAPKVESTLFEDLKGDWTIETKLYVSNPEGVWVKSETASKTGVKITDNIEYPASLTDADYAVYEALGKDKAEVDILFDEFKVSVAEFNATTVGQNRLVCLGLDFGATYTEFESAFDLFVHESYSKAVTPADCLYDFGPKWYLEIADGDVVTLPIDPYRVLPLSNWSDYIGLSAVCVDPYESHPERPKAFNVTISEDKNTITINSLIHDDKTYTLAAVVNSLGIEIADFIASEIVLTRGKYTGEPTPTKMPMYKAINGTNKFVKSHKMTRFDKTRGPKNQYSNVKVSISDFLEKSKMLLK